jgi:hypothetical protein
VGILGNLLPSIAKHTLGSTAAGRASVAVSLPAVIDIHRWIVTKLITRKSPRCLMATIDDRNMWLHASP